MATRRTKTLEAGAPFARAAAIVGLDDDPQRVRVRVAAPRAGSATRAAVARLALSTPYRPAEGDRVLVIDGEDDLYVIGVLHAAGARELPIEGGGAVRVEGGAVEIRDAEDRIVVRYAGGAAEIAAPAGDLTLSAPAGRVVVRAAEAVEIAAGAPEEPQIRVGATEAAVRAPHVVVEAATARLTVGKATIVADRIVTTATSVAQTVERFELSAARLVERTRDAFRDVTGLAETRVGRARTIVKDAFSLHARTTSMASTEDTSIDGRRVLLG